MTDTSYNPGYAPFAAWAVRQAPVPATTHNLPSTVAAGGSVTSSLIVTEGFSLISAGVTSTQAGSLTIQRYLDAGGTVPQGAASSVALTAASAANLDVLDGKPFASFRLSVSNSGSNAAALTGFALLLQASVAQGTGGGGSGGGSGGAITASDGAITTIGTTTDAAWSAGGGSLVALGKAFIGAIKGKLQVNIVDPTTGVGALVQAFHNADNQALGTAYGVMTGGVDQLLNSVGNLDRKRGVAGDAMTMTGLAAEVPMLWNGASYDRAPGSAIIGARIAQVPAVVTAASFTRPANTTSYAFGQLVANSATAASVTPVAITAAKAVNTPGVILRCRLQKTGTGLTNAIFRLHLYNTLPAVTNGDGAAWLSSQSAGYIGSMDVTVDKAMSDGAIGIGIATTGAGLCFVPATGTQTIYGLLEARAAYTPVSGESFTVTVEVQ